MKIGDRIIFTLLGDAGTIVARDGTKFDRPWQVQWDASGVTTYPKASCLKLIEPQPQQ